MTAALEFDDLKLLDRIGEGASSIVYRAAYGTSTVAVKISKEELTDRTRLAVRREAAALARASNPGLVRVLDVGESNGRAYLVMEYLEGDTLRSRLERGPLPEKDAIGICIQLAQALGTLHAQGIVHRDVKPENVLFDAGGAPRVIDLSLAGRQQTNGTGDGLLGGTPLYMSPEQGGVLKREVDGRADLYSLGGILFECLAGSTPFQAVDAAALLHLHAARPAPDVREVNPEVSVAAAAIVARLLAKDPDDRYQTGEDLAADLRQIDELNEVLRRGGTPQLRLIKSTLTDNSAVPLLGRTSELKALINSWELVKGTRQGTAVEVYGEAGCGKTRLCREFLAQVGDGVQVLHGRCSYGNAIPFAPFRTAIDEHVRSVKRLPPDQREEGLAKIKAAVGGFGPVLRNFSRELTSVLADSDDGDMVAATKSFEKASYEAVAQLVCNILVDRGPGILFLDDIHWIDGASNETLKRMSVLLNGIPLLLLCTSREAPQENEAPDACSASVDNPFIKVALHLSSLPEAPARDLISAHLGNYPIGSGFIKSVITRAGGNPFAIEEYVRAAMDGGLLRFSWGVWKVDEQSFEGLSLDKDLVEIMLRRADNIGENARRVLTTASRIGPRFRAALLPAACKLEPAAVHPALEEACRAHLLERTELGEYGFVHNRIQEAFSESLTPGVARQVHQLLAEAMQLDPSDDDLYAYELARHLSLGTVAADPQRVYEANLDAGHRAVAGGAAEAAHGFLKQADEVARAHDLKITPDLLLELGHVCFSAGQMEECKSVSERGLELCTDAWQRAQFLIQIAHVHEHAENNQLALDTLARAFGEVKRPVPRATPLGMITLMGKAIVNLILGLTGFRFGSARGAERHQYQVLASAYDLQMMAGLGGSNAVGIINAVANYFRVGHYLGLTKEAAAGYVYFANFFNLLGIKPLFEKFAAKGIAFAEKMNNRLLASNLTVFREVFRTIGGTNTEQAFRKLQDESRPWLSAFNYALTHCFLNQLLYLRGCFSELAPRVDQATKFSLSHGICHRVPGFTSSVAVLAALGRTSEATYYFNLYGNLLDSGRTNTFRVLPFAGALLHFHLEQGELGAPMDEVMEKANQLGWKSKDLLFESHMFYMNQGYARIAQLMNALPAKRPEALERARAAVTEFSKIPMTPAYKPHLLAQQGALAAFERKDEEALKLFAEAERLSDEMESYWARFEVHRYRAHLLRDMGREGPALREAQLAYWLAAENEWVNRAKWIRKEFPTLHLPAGTGASTTAHLTRTMATTAIKNMTMGTQSIKNLPTTSLKGARATSSLRASMTQDISINRFQRQMESLMQVSLALSVIKDPDELAQIALREIVQLLGAERAVLFLTDEKTGELEVKAGRDFDGTELRQISGFSSTVVRRVSTQRKPLVLSGTDEGEVLGSESAVVHNLRSIMAAPLILKDRLLGVIYLDNRLTKGVFGEEQLDVLMAIGNQIIFSLESARATQLELQKAVLDKDLEVTGAVQSLLLPVQNEEQIDGLKLVGFFRSAAQSGGDWWWYEKVGGKLRIILADVTGHGPASAMIASAVASSYHISRRLGVHVVTERVLDVLNAHLVELCRKQYGVSATIVEIDRARGKVTAWRAGSPPVFVHRADGSSKTCAQVSSPLGYSTESNVSKEIVDFKSGDRVMIFTDGAYEFDVAGLGPLGLKQLRRVFEATQQLPLADARQQIFEKLSAKCGGADKFDDDLTYVLVEAA